MQDKVHISGIIFVGIMFLTVGILYFFNYRDWPIWVVGTGAGFIAMAFCRLYEKRFASGVAFVGFLLFFMGLGYLLGWDLAGMYIGLGIGFIATALFKLYEKHKLD